MKDLLTTILALAALVISAFAIIGMWATFLFIKDYKSPNTEVDQYVANCSKVKIGMTLKEVREVMRDSTRNAMKESPQLYYNYNPFEPSYSLTYPSFPGASGWPTIQFDTATMKVNRVMCDIN
jgi:hypothetical protein